jgi:hypothetical protein
MKNFVLYDATGNIKITSICEDNELSSQNRPNLTLLETLAYISFNDGYVSNNEYVAYTSEQRALKDNRPYYPAKWSNNTMSWEDLRSSQEKLDQQWYIVKSQRDQLLQESDWRVIKASDTGVPISQNWKDYRQALRDITTQSDPFNIIWPTPPTA